MKREINRNSRAWRSNTGKPIFNTSSATSMARMFEGAVIYDADIALWKTDKVTDMSSMFKDVRSVRARKNITHT